jgi:hypothetical protein
LKNWHAAPRPPPPYVVDANLVSSFGAEMDHQLAKVARTMLADVTNVALQKALNRARKRATLDFAVFYDFFCFFFDVE